MSADKVQSVAEAIQKLRSAKTPEQLAECTAEYAVVIDAVADMEINPVQRCAGLDLIASHGAHFEAADAIKGSFQAIIATLGQEDNALVPKQLLLSAVKAAIELSKGAPAAKQAEMVSLSADLLIQVIMNEAGYPNTVRTRAKEGLSELAEVCLAGVQMKLLHLLSNHREEEDEAVLEAERFFALKQLRFFYTNKRFAGQCKEDVQNKLLYYLTLLLPTITFNEARHLIHTVALLPIVKSGEGTPLLDTFLKAKFEGGLSSRLLDTLLIISSSLGKLPEHEELSKYILGLLTSAGPAVPAPKKPGRKGKAAAASPVIPEATPETDLGFKLAKVAYFGANVCPASSAGAYYAALVPLVITALELGPAPEEGLPHLPQNIAEAEAMLLALLKIASKVPEALSETLKPDGDKPSVLAQRCAAALPGITLARKQLIYLVHRAFINKEQDTLGSLEADGVTFLRSLELLLPPLAEGRTSDVLPTPSWEKSLSLSQIAAFGGYSAEQHKIAAPSEESRKRLRHQASFLEQAVKKSRMK